MQEIISKTDYLISDDGYSRQALVGKTLLSKTYVKDGLIHPYETFFVLAYENDNFICVKDDKYFILSVPELVKIVNSEDQTKELPAALLQSSSTMNFLLLRNLFPKDESIEKVLPGEVIDFFNEFAQDETIRRHRRIKENFSDELRDGDYFEDLSISETRAKFHDYFLTFLDEEEAAMMADYYMSLIPEGSGPRTDDIPVSSTDKYSIKAGDRSVQAMVSLNPEHGNEEYPGHTEVLVWLEVDGKDASDVSSIFVKTS